jgi:putative ABC transport system substrate-binding protein
MPSLLKRREFITLLSSATAWPIAVRAQQLGERRIGVLMNRAADNPEGQARIAAFQQGLQQLGWSDGRKVHIDIRWGEDDVERERKYARELNALALSVTALQQVNRSTPIVFVAVTDPVGAGLVASLARPGGNATGFMIYEYSFGGKRLDLLRQIAPGVTRVGILRDPTNPAGGAEFAAIQAMAQSLRIGVNPLDSREHTEIERAISDFAGSPNAGLIVIPNASTSRQADLIIALAAQHKLPAVYPFRFMAAGGGLLSYGPDVVDQCREAAAYVDRILKGEKPADLPVQVPTKYELVVNLKTARALGISVPPMLLARADEVIE